MHKRSVIPFIIFTLLIFTIFSPTNSYSSELRTQLEQAMGNVRKAIKNGNYKEYKASLDPTKQDDQMSENQFNSVIINSESKNMLYNVIPDFSNETKFIHLVDKGEWAIYFAETNLEDKDYLTVSAFVFHKENEEWYYAGITNGLIKARPNSKYAKQGRGAWSGMDEIMNSILTDPNFQLENLIKKRELINKKEN